MSVYSLRVGCGVVKLHPLEYENTNDNNGCSVTAMAKGSTSVYVKGPLPTNNE